MQLVRNISKEILLKDRYKQSLEIFKFLLLPHQTYLRNNGDLLINILSRREILCQIQNLDLLMPNKRCKNCTQGFDLHIKISIKNLVKHLHGQLQEVLMVEQCLKMALIPGSVDYSMDQKEISLLFKDCLMFDMEFKI